MPTAMSVSVVSAMAVLGALVGCVLALASARMAQDEPVLRPGRLRLFVLSAGGAAIGVWSAFAGAMLDLPSFPMMAATALLGWQLLLIGLIDAEHFWLPDRLTWPLALTGLVANGLLLQGLPWSQLVGLVAGFVVLWMVGAVYRLIRRREGLGGGDPFLMAGAGAWVGWTGLPSVLLWACAGGLGLVLARLILRRSVNGTDRLPFGTFLVLGIWLTWLFGPVGVQA